MSLRIERELPSADIGEMRLLYRDLEAYWTAALAPHCQVEADALLQRIAHHDDAGLKRAGRLQRDHRDLERRFEAVRAARTADERRESLQAFGRALGDHVRWKERDLFEWMQAALGDGDLDAIEADVACALPTGPVPCPMPHDP